VELYRDDLYLDPESMKKIPQYHPGTDETGDHAQTYSARHSDAAQILDRQLSSRKKWERFDLEEPALVRLTWREWDFYEINNGYIAYCLGKADGDSIHFRELRHPLDEVSGRNWEVIVSAKCSDFTFDLSQDVLVMAEAIDGYERARDSFTLYAILFSVSYQ
jgi:hypothetical protein